MVQDEFFKIIGILIVGFFIIYMSIKMFQLQTNIVEGLTNNDGSGSSSSSSFSSGLGETGSASTYAANIKSQVVKLQDELLVSKYRKEYESSIINMDDYVGYLMIKQVLNINLSNDQKKVIESINNLNILKNAKDSLNSAMTFLDKQ
jgi:hypothetical protein